MSNVHVGTMGWSYGFWKGSFYPEDLAASDFLAFYSKQFDTVEVDSTFYRIPREETVLDWKQQTTSGFLFSPKFPQKITHVKMLRDSVEETGVFLERVALLGEKLGPLLLQLPPNFKDEGFVFLREFLKKLPEQHRYVVEVRNRRLIGSELCSILRENNVTLAWAESAGQPAITELTGDFIYVRWEGDRKKVNGTLGKTEIDKTDDIKTWAIKLKAFIKRQTEIFGYYSKYYTGNPPADVECFVNSLTK